MSDIKTLAIEKLNELNPEYPELIEDIVVANKKIYLSLKTDKAKVDKFTKIKLQIEKELAEEMTAFTDNKTEAIEEETPAEPV